MKVKIAFIGFRHGHINGVYQFMEKKNNVEIVAACEEDAKTRETLKAKGTPQITHSDHNHLLDTVECDAVAIGDYYGKRGSLIIDALKCNKHVIVDKPLCTTLAEYNKIEELARKKKLTVAVLLNMREGGTSIKMRELIRSGAIGEPHTIVFTGQHPLNYGSRASWYFEKGKHGGTINDIAVHTIDLIPWLTGIPFTMINAARNWNAGFPEVKFFKNAAQLMLTMKNGCGVLGDVSYFAPDSFGYSLPQYWRIMICGREGIIESPMALGKIMLYKNGKKEMESIEPAQSLSGKCIESFLQEVRGEKADPLFSSAEYLESSRISLMVQQAADGGACNVPIS